MPTRSPRPRRDGTVDGAKANDSRVSGRTPDQPPCAVVHHRRARSLTAAALVMACALVLAACGTAQPGSYPRGPRDLVLQLVDIPGFLAPGQPTSIVPTFSMYGDGTVLVHRDGEYDGSLPVIRELRLSQERTQQLVQAALDAGVQGDKTESIDVGPDAPTSILTLSAEGQAGSSELGPQAGGGLGDLRKVLRAYATKKQATPYHHDAIAVVATTNTGGTPTRTWPFDPIRANAELHVDQSLCTVYRRTGVSDLTATARAADRNTTWVSGNETFTLQFRPLLPNESTCKSLVHKAKESKTS